MSSMSFVIMLLAIQVGMYFTGKHFGYRDGVKDGHSLAVEAMCFDVDVDFDDGPDDDGGEPLPKPNLQLVDVAGKRTS